MEKNILILDDNQDILDIVQEVLTYEGYLVSGASNCADFYRALAGSLPDLILLDFKLADGDGGEICAALKAATETMHIPVIIFTAYFVGNIDLFSYGCDAVIFKPFDIVHLNEQVGILLKVPGLN